MGGCKFKDKNKNVKHKLITNLDKVDGIQISSDCPFLP